MTGKISCEQKRCRHISSMIEFHSIGKSLATRTSFQLTSVPPTNKKRLNRWVINFNNKLFQCRLRHDTCFMFQALTAEVFLFKQIIYSALGNFCAWLMIPINLGCLKFAPSDRVRRKTLSRCKKMGTFRRSHCATGCLKEPCAASRKRTSM